VYTTYATHAFVLKLVPIGEADMLVVLYTEDFGLIRARAVSIRAETSKMRYAVQELHTARVALVRAKSGWRLTGAEHTSSPEKEDIPRIARFARLLERLVHGEGKEEGVFAQCIFVSKKSENEEMSQSRELIAVLRMLYILGYISREAVSPESHVLDSTEFQIEAIARAERAQLLSLVNQALTQSHL
jgi:recombinational DNA repair protein (RecF pathway)